MFTCIVRKRFKKNDLSPEWTVHPEDCVNLSFILRKDGCLELKEPYLINLEKDNSRLRGPMEKFTTLLYKLGILKT